MLISFCTSKKKLTLNMLMANLTDNKYWCLSYFFQKTSADISHDSSPKKTIHRQCQQAFWKKERKNINSCLLIFKINRLRVKNQTAQKIYCRKTVIIPQGNRKEPIQAAHIHSLPTRQCWTWTRFKIMTLYTQTIKAQNWQRWWTILVQIPVVLVINNTGFPWQAPNATNYTKPLKRFNPVNITV